MTMLFKHSQFSYLYYKFFIKFHHIIIYITPYKEKYLSYVSLLFQLLFIQNFTKFKVAQIKIIKHPGFYHGISETLVLTLNWILIFTYVHIFFYQSFTTAYVFI